MRYYFLELLACPVCKHHPLLLYPVEVEEKPVDDETLKRVRCREYCGYLRRPAGEVGISTCRECARKYIKTGVLICERCGRWYPILDGIPRMLDGKYRRKMDDIRFLKNYYDKLPEEAKRLMKNPDPKQLLSEIGF